MKLYFTWKMMLILASLLQEPNSALLKTKFSNPEAVIFKKSYTEILVLPKDVIRFTPTRAHVLEVEQILCDTVRGFQNRYRQYAAYIANERDSVIVANILKSKVIARIGNTWQREYVFGLGHFYEKNQSIIYFNLTSLKIFNPDGTDG